MNSIIKNFKDIEYGPAPEDAQDVLRWIKNLSSPNRIYINGKWISSKSSKKFFCFMTPRTYVSSI